MRTTTILGSIAILSILSFAAGCAGREVEVTGEAKAAASTTLSGPISIKFLEVSDESAAVAEYVSIKTIELASPGEFKEMVGVEGDTVYLFALNDVNKDGACSEGEAWAKAEAAVKEDGTLDKVTLELAVADCALAGSAAGAQ